MSVFLVAGTCVVPIQSAYPENVAHSSAPAKTTSGAGQDPAITAQSQPIGPPREREKDRVFEVDKSAGAHPGRVGSFEEGPLLETLLWGSGGAVAGSLAGPAGAAIGGAVGAVTGFVIGMIYRPKKSAGAAQRKPRRASFPNWSSSDR